MKKFMYGVSTSAFQIEGDDGAQGRGKSVWDNYCEREGIIHNNENAKVTTDHYNRYREDVALMAESGIDSYRFSTSWSRIFPDGIGKINEKGADFYDRLIDELLKYGIEPLLTMYHWDLPQALSDRGGFQNPDFSEWFASYAGFIAKRYGDRVKFFCTFNEPINAVHSSYYAGTFAPGYRLNEEQALWCIYRLHEAHGKACSILHEVVKNSICGVAMSTFEEYPAVNTEKCVQVAKEKFFACSQLTEAVDVYLDPVYLGRYPRRVEEKYPEFAEKTRDIGKICESAKSDYVGFNTYSGCPIKENGEIAARPSGVPVSVIGADIDSKGLYWGTKFLAERYKKPVYILENGTACPDWVSVDGKIHDTDRIDFFKRHLAEVEKLQRENVDIRGYFVWSILDNFEWLKGYTCRFGLVHVDYETLKRTPKDSFYFYRDYIKSKK